MARGVALPLLLLVVAASATENLFEWQQVQYEQARAAGRLLSAPEGARGVIDDRLVEAAYVNPTTTLSSASLSREARDASRAPRAPVNIWTSGGLSFAEFDFEGGVSFYWNKRNTTHVLALVSTVPYLSVDNGRNFNSLENVLPDFFSVQPPAFGTTGGHGVREIYVSDTDDNLIILTSFGMFYWTTFNGGDSWLKVETPGLALRNFVFHPTNAGLILASHIPDACFKANPTITCSVQLYLSSSYGASYQVLATHVWSFSWGAYLNSGREDDSIYILSSFDVTTKQFNANADGSLDFSPSNGAVRDLNIYDMSDASRINALHDAQAMLVWGYYVFAIVRIYTNPSIASVQLWVSSRGDLFKPSTLTGVANSLFLINDVFEGGVVLSQISRSQALPLANIFTSGPNGYHYVRAVTNVLAIPGSFWVDFTKLGSFKAAYVATTVVSINGNIRLRSVISWNRGADWKPVQTQDGLNGLIDESAFPMLLFGTLHQNFISGDHLGIYSEKSAPGLVLAMGAHDVTADGYINYRAQGDVYYSRNGGLSFSKILDGAHMCSFLDEGIVIICVPSYAPTNRFLYSYTAGLSWSNVTFAARPVNIQGVEADPDNYGLGAILVATEVANDADDIFFQVDLAQLRWPDCAAFTTETWTPTDDRVNNRCLLGEKITYRRVAPGQPCHSSIDDVILSSSRCPCAATDYECAWQYVLVGTSCVLEAGASLPAQNCSGDSYTVPSGYRLIPGDVCDPNVLGAEDLTVGVSVPCPNKAVVEDVTRQRNLAIGLGVGLTLFVVIGLAVTYLLYRRWVRNGGGRRSYGRVTNEIAVGTGDDDDHLFDDDQVDEDEDAQSIAGVSTRAIAPASVRTSSSTSTTTATMAKASPTTRSTSVGMDEDDIELN